MTRWRIAAGVAPSATLIPISGTRWADGLGHHAINAEHCEAERQDREQSDQTEHEAARRQDLVDSLLERRDAGERLIGSSCRMIARAPGSTSRGSPAVRTSRLLIEMLDGWRCER